MRPAFLTPAELESDSSPSAASRGGLRRIHRPLSQILRDEPRLRRFCRCLLATGLLDDLDEAGPYTVFTPSDAVLTQSQPVFESWFDPDLTSLLFDVSEFHVVRGLIHEPPLPCSIRTLEGRSLTLEFGVRGLLVNDQALVQESWLTQNGLIHWVDRVLVPSGIRLEEDGSLSLVSRDRPSGMRLIQAPRSVVDAENLGGARQVE